MTKEDFIQLYQNFKGINLEDDIIIRLKKLLNEFPLSYKNIISEIKETIITKEQAIEDAEDFFLSLKYCYCGYEYFSKFVDFDDLKDNLINLITNRPDEFISATEFGELLYNQISDYIHDGHFSIMGLGFGRFVKLWRAYVTDVVVEANDDEYRVIKGNRRLPAGTLIEKFLLEGKLLSTLMIGNYNECFLIGVYSKEKLDYINIGDIKLCTHIINSDKYEENCCKYIHKYEEHMNYNVFFSKSYVINENAKETLEEYGNFGRKCRDKKITIFDIAGNRGGNSRFPQSFINGLNDYAYWQCGCAVLLNPIFYPQKNGKYYDIVIQPQDYDYSQSKYNGTLYVVMNKWNASSGESAVSYAKSCSKVIFLGSATGGIGEFGDVKSYRLVNSKLYYCFGYKIFHMADFEEGKGFMPDYWIDSRNPTGYLKRYLKFKKLI